MRAPAGRRRGHGRPELARGALAGAVGTAALDASTYLDMTVRGRPASPTPEQTVERLLGLLGIPLPADEKSRGRLTKALGALLGATAGVGAGAVVGGLRSRGRPRTAGGTFLTTFTVVMLVGNGPMTVLGVTDPRSWSVEDWLADVLPHLAYAAAATVAFEASRRPSSRRRLLPLP